MILEEKSYRIKKITKSEGYWNLYPEKHDAPIKLKADLVCGNLPPVKKWPWQRHILNIKTVVFGKYIVYAEMDGLVLFNISEDEYPNNIKAEISRIEKIEADYAAYQERLDTSIKELLQKLLPQLPEIKDLEEEVNKLPVCWRAYLKMRLPLHYESNEAKQRLILTLLLTQIANRIYCRYVDGDEPLEVAFGSLKFSICDKSFDLLECTLIDGFDNNQKYRNLKAFMFYNEIKQELERVLPPLESTLGLYLVQQICRMLSAYSSDYATFTLHRPRDLWGNNLSTDNLAYRHLCSKMTLPMLSSLIIEKKFSTDDVKNFSFVF